MRCSSRGCLRSAHDDRPSPATHGIAAVCAADIVWDASALEGPITRIYHGHDGVRQYFSEWLESFEAHEARAEKFIEAGDDVIVGIRLRGRGKASGVEVEMARCNVYRMRDGLAVRVEPYETEAEALQAAGL